MFELVDMPKKNQTYVLCNNRSTPPSIGHVASSGRSPRNWPRWPPAALLSLLGTNIYCHNNIISEVLAIFGVNMG